MLIAMKIEASNQNNVSTHSLVALTFFRTVCLFVLKLTSNQKFVIFYSIQRKKTNEISAGQQSVLAADHEGATYMTVVEGHGDGLGDEEDFRPVAADDQQEAVRNLMVGGD